MNDKNEDILGVRNYLLQANILEFPQNIECITQRLSQMLSCSSNEKKKTAVRRQPHSPLQLKLKCGEHSHHPISVSGCFPPPDLLCEQFSLMMSISPNVFIIFSGITRFSAQQAMFFIAGPACGEAKAELFTAIHSFLAVSVSFPILLCY